MYFLGKLLVILSCLTLSSRARPWNDSAIGKDELVALSTLYDSLCTKGPDQHSMCQTHFGWSLSIDPCGPDAFWSGITCAMDLRNDGKMYVESLNLSSKEIDISGADSSSQSFLLNGTIPIAVSNFKNATKFNFSSNNLSGELPGWFASLTKLKELILRNNKFTAAPSVLSQMNFLRHLDLSYNELGQSPPLDAFPASLSNLVSIETLIVSNSGLSGPIPEAISGMSNLQQLDLSFNDLSGSLPRWLGSLLSLQSLDVRYNRLSGMLPFYLYSVRYRWLQGNKFCSDRIGSPCSGMRATLILLAGGTVVFICFMFSLSMWNLSVRRRQAQRMAILVARREEQRQESVKEEVAFDVDYPPMYPVYLNGVLVGVAQVEDKGESSQRGD